MLRVRIIPKLLLKNGRNVKGRRFEQLRDVGNPVSNARIYNAQGADELIFLDIDASNSGRGTLLDVVRKAAAEVFMPFAVGGGVSDRSHIRELLKAGADKVCINTAAVEQPDLIREGSRSFGSQCIVVSIDYRRVDGRERVFTHGGRRNSELDPVEHAVHMVSLGAGEVLLTSIDRDGSMEGYDIELIRRVADEVPVPVIASGGPGNLQHLADAILRANASAVAVGSLFHFTDQSPIKAHGFMRTAGVDVRDDV